MIAACAACAACGRVSFDARPDAGPDAAATTPWGPATPVLPAAGEGNPSLTSDLLVMYFSDAGGTKVVTRPSVSSPWTAPVNDAVLNPANTPEITSDGLTIFVSRGVPYDIWTSARPTRMAAWSPPVKVLELSSPQVEGAATPTDDLRSIVLGSDRSGESEIYASARGTTAAPWDTPIPISEVNSTSTDCDPILSADHLTLYFRSDRSGNAELYTATRASVGSPFDAPAPISELDTPGFESDPWVSPDGHHIFFASDRSGTLGLWEASR